MPRSPSWYLLSLSSFSSRSWWDISILDGVPVVPSDVDCLLKTGSSCWSICSNTPLSGAQVSLWGLAQTPLRQHCAVHALQDFAQALKVRQFFSVYDSASHGPSWFTNESRYERSWYRHQQDLSSGYPWSASRNTHIWPREWQPNWGCHQSWNIKLPCKGKVSGVPRWTG